MLIWPKKCLMGTSRPADCSPQRHLQVQFLQHNNISQQLYYACALVVNTVARRSHACNPRGMSTFMSLCRKSTPSQPFMKLCWNNTYVCMGPQNSTKYLIAIVVCQLIYIWVCGCVYVWLDQTLIAFKESFQIALNIQAFYNQTFHDLANAYPSHSD